MSDITPASTNVLYHGDVNFKNPTPVIELYPRAYGQQDEFVPAEGGKGNKRNPSFLGSFLKYLAITGAVVFAGRKGLFGQKIKGWLGGFPKAVKPEEVFKRIEARMAEFLGKNGDVIKSTKITTAADGSSILRTEFENGAVKEYAIKQGEKVIKLFGKNDKNFDQYILFDKTDGAVLYRTELERDSAGKVKEYLSYKGEDILNADFTDATGLFRHYVKKDPIGKIETKMADYLDGVEEKFAQVAGRTKDTVTSAKIITAADGTAVLRAEYQSGKIKEYTVKHGNNNVIKLIGEGSEEMNSTFRKLFGRKGRKENLNIEEYILFDKADGAVKYRTEIARIPGGKVRGYFSYKGEDVLDPAFREDLNKFKDFIAAREKKKFWLFGPKIEKTAMKFYNDPVSGNPTVVKTKRTYKKGVRREMVRDYGSMIRKFIYNKDGKLIDTIEKP